MRAPDGASARRVALLLLALCAAPGAGPAAGQVDVPTFARDVAPILFRSCAACHRPGGPAPFSVLSWDEVRDRAGSIAQETARGSMPPWLPAAGHRAFEGERRLTADAVETLRRWAAAGAPPGDLDRLPPPPPPPAEWPLGEPDFVLEAPAFTVPATGGDLYRNLVLPGPPAGPWFIRAVDLRPGGGGLVHHARLMVDTTASSRAADAEDPGPGFDGMIPGGHARNPPGRFVGWTPGRVPHDGWAGMAWPLEPGTDLVLQLHLRPRGREGVVRSRIGLYLADAPPSRRSVLVSLGTEIIDIPAGAAAYAVRDTFRLPVRATVLSIYPHAHYLGKTVAAVAHLPGGGADTILHIEDWDFDWQDEYRLAEPMELPAGTLLEMRFSYDNSAANPRNPHDPPRRVRYGSASTDEMADLLVQVEVEGPSDARVLERALSGKYEHAAVTWAAWDERMQAEAAADRGDRAAALRHYRASLRNREDAGVLGAMAELVLEDGDAAAALIIAERAARVSRRSDPRVLQTLARAYLAAGRRAAAEDALGRALERARELGDAALVEEIGAALRRVRASSGVRRTGPGTGR